MAKYQLQTLYVYHSAVSGKFVYDTDLHLVSNSSKEDLKFLEDISTLFKGMQRVTYGLPMYKVYANKVYRDMETCLKVCVRAYVIIIGWWQLIMFLLSLFPLKSVCEFGSKQAEKVIAKMASGEEPGEVQSLLEQWLREGKLSREEAVALSSDMFSAGVHTVL